MNVLESNDLERGTILHGDLQLPVEMIVPSEAVGVVIFAHGSGGSRYNRRNQALATALRERGIATVLFDLLSQAEEKEEYHTGHLRFDIRLLSERLISATHWVVKQETACGLPLGYFGSSTGAAAALVASAKLGPEIKAVVSRGGRADLAGALLPLVVAPTLLIVGGHDETVLHLNEDARKRMRCKTTIQIVPGATHLFAEFGALEQVAQLAGDFFLEQFQPTEGL